MILNLRSWIYIHSNWCSITESAVKHSMTLCLLFLLSGRHYLDKITKGQEYLIHKQGSHSKNSFRWANALRKKEKHSTNNPIRSPGLWNRENYCMKRHIDTVSPGSDQDTPL